MAYYWTRKKPSICWNSIRAWWTVSYETHQVISQGTLNCWLEPKHQNITVPINKCSWYRMSYTCQNAIFMACRTTRFFLRQTPVSARVYTVCWNRDSWSILLMPEIIQSFALHLKHLDFTFEAPRFYIWSTSMVCHHAYMRTWIELLHKQALYPPGIFRSPKSGGLLVSFASISWVIKKLQVTASMVTLLCSGRPAKLSVDAGAL